MFFLVFQGSRLVLQRYLLDLYLGPTIPLGQSFGFGLVMMMMVTMMVMNLITKMMMNNRKEKECGLLVFSGRFPQLPLREQNIGTGDEDDDDCDDDTRILRSWR